MKRKIIESKTITGFFCLTPEEMQSLEDLAGRFPLESFLSNDSFVGKFGIDFVHVSARIAGNDYTMIDTLALLEYGITAAKKFSHVEMILRLREAWETLIREDLAPEAETARRLHAILCKEELPEKELEAIFARCGGRGDPFELGVCLHCGILGLGGCAGHTARLMLNVALKSAGKMLWIPGAGRISRYRAAAELCRLRGACAEFASCLREDYRETVDLLLDATDPQRAEEEGREILRRRKV